MVEVEPGVFRKFTKKERNDRWNRKNPNYARDYYIRNKARMNEAGKQLRLNNHDRYYAAKGVKLNSIEGWLKYKLQTARCGARRRNLEFTLTIEQIRSLLTTHCPVLGIELDYRLARTKKVSIPRGNSPSLDRIDNTKGYTIDNVVLVSNIVNRIKTSLTLQEIPEVTGKIITFYDKYRTGK